VTKRYGLTSDVVRSQYETVSDDEVVVAAAIRVAPTARLSEPARNATSAAHITTVRRIAESYGSGRLWA
jgi:hypothetical protein